MNVNKNILLGVGILLVSLIYTPYSMSTELETANIYVKAIGNAKRTQSDIPNDQKRNPLSILPFTQIKTGDKVLELGAGGGYSTELVSWVVGSSGKVYAHFLHNQDRLANNRLANVISLQQHSLNDHREVLKENQIQNNQLDTVIVFFILHDIYLNNEMSNELLVTLYDSLKPGGNLIILDNAAKPDSGLRYVESLHRIGENFVKSEMANAGFIFDSSTDVLRNKADDHTKPWGDFNGLQDRFALRFKKPAK